ncbi:MAG: endonuclease/exonuclease/phosphatase family protein, partial [Campylobacterota bacterium]|nr:endonuclease/exonuclease/phosphatase family protein [Campylobacterota bacterium]
MRYLFLFLLPLLLFSKPFKVATYNVENLFDANFQGTEYKEYIPGKHNWNQRMVEIKLNHTAEVICDLDADILGLQEIENSIIFDALLKRLKRVGCEYRYGAITHKKGASIQVALLSRFPIIHQKELQVSYSPRVRNILEVEVEVEGNPLTLFVNHWKSKSRKGVESKRIKYAKTLQKRILTLPVNKEYIILGDLNSNYNAHLTLDKRIDDTNGATGIGDVLQTTIDKKLAQEYQMLKATKGTHYNTWQEVPFKYRWSHKFYGNRSTLDHILLPSNMFDHQGLDYINNSFKVFKASYLFTKKGYINGWRYKNGKHMAKGYSDHLPIYALFDTKPYVDEKVTRRVTKTVSQNIEYLYSVEELNSEIGLKDAVVVLKRRNHAIIKQTPHGRGIYLYGCAKGLKEGNKYDLLVQSITSYNGLKEVTDVIKLKEKGKVSLESYYHSSKELDPSRLKQNEVIRNLTGVYRNKKFIIEGKEFPIYFKKKKDTPPNGAKLKIHYAHLGYYKKLQLVIYSHKD